jgi:flagellar biosynthetic protein FlhB
MAEESFEEKTEKPTPKKRQEARSKGEVAKSMEVSSVAVILAGLMTLAIFGPYIYSYIQMIMKGSFSLITLRDLTRPLFMEFARNTTTSLILAIIPLMAAVFITAILSNIMQVGFLLSGESIKPKFSKLNPLKGLSRLFSKQSFMELFKSLMKLVIIGGVAYLTVKGEMKNIFFLGEMEPNSIFVYILITILKILVLCVLSMIPLVIIDYAFKRWEYENKLKMGKQEVKDEHKRSEGDPKIKSRIRSIQMEMARKRIMQAVPEADVVITNPTHLAVAIKYESSVMTAPKLLAKGAGRIAKRIKELAEKHDIPIVENKKLAQSLYTLVEVDQEIPPTLYQAVAEVLAFIYKLKGNDAYGGVRS